MAVNKNGAHQLYEMTERSKISDNTVIKVIGICDASRSSGLSDLRLIAKWFGFEVSTSYLRPKERTLRLLN